MQYIGSRRSGFDYNTPDDFFSGAFYQFKLYPIFPYYYILLPRLPQIPRRPTLHNSASIKPQTPRRILDCLEPVRNRNHSTLLELLPQDPLHRRRGTPINRRRRLVKNHKPASSQHSSADTHELSLPLTQVLAPRVDARVESPVIPKDPLDSVVAFLLGKLGFRVDVVAERAGEQNRVLLDKCDAVTQRCAVYVREVDASY
ncbi:hypothetical protein HG531_011292 [Fusarium graminearum]|nr:hypothetical protein HG531_011292 [Fusarium graminearum]